MLRFRVDFLHEKARRRTETNDEIFGQLRPLYMTRRERYLATESAVFAELLARSSFSFLRGASHPEEMVCSAKELGLDAIALCDRDGLYGSVRALRASRELEQCGLCRAYLRSCAGRGSARSIHIGLRDEFMLHQLFQALELRSGVHLLRLSGIQRGLRARDFFAPPLAAYLT